MNLLIHICEHPILSTCTIVLVTLILASNIFIVLSSYPIGATNSEYIRRGAALTRLWYGKHKVSVVPYNIITFIQYRAHLYLTYAFVRYTYRHIRDNTIMKRLMDLL